MKSTIGDWFLPGHTERARETVEKAGKSVSAGAAALATCYEIASKAMVEFAAHIELIEDLQDRIKQLETKHLAEAENERNH